MKVLMLRHNLHQIVLDHASEVYAVLDDSAGCRSLSAETLARFAGIYRISSYDSLEEISAVAGDLLTRGVAIDRVVSFAEFTQLAAGYVAHLLGLEHFSPKLALATRDKRVMKVKAAAAGLAVPRWYSVPDLGSADPAAIERTVGLPLVVKPASGFGTMATVRVDEPGALAQALQDVAAEMPELMAGQLLVEEFIDGDEFHIDSVWHEGEPWIFCVSRYFVPLLQSWSDGDQPNGSIMLTEADHPELYRDLLALHIRLNEAIELRRGATHLEVFQERGTGRIVVSEIASRVGGANISDMVAARTGVHGGTIAIHELLDGDIADLGLSDGKFPVIGHLALVPNKPGTIVAIPSADELLQHPHVVHAAVHRAVGDTVETSASEWCVLLVLGADSENQLFEVVDDVSATYRIEVAATPRRPEEQSE